MILFDYQTKNKMKKLNNFNENQKSKFQRKENILEDYFILFRKCSSQLNRANIFCTQKIQYFISKYFIKSIDEHIDEITLIVKYFYLYVLCKFRLNRIKY